MESKLGWSKVMRWIWPSSGYAKAAVGLVSILLVCFLISICLMKKPQFEVTLSQVIDEGEWLRLEFDVLNCTLFDLEVFSYGTNWPGKDRSEIMVFLRFDDELGSPIIGDQRTFRQMYDSPVSNQTYTTLKRRARRTGVMYIHQELGGQKMVFNFIKNDGGILFRKSREQVRFLDGMFHLGLQSRFVSMSAPIPVKSEPFVANDIISRETALPLLQRAEAFVENVTTAEVPMLEKYQAWEQLQLFVSEAKDAANLDFLDAGYWDETAQYEIDEIEKSGQLVDFLALSRELKEKRVFHLWNRHRNEDAKRYKNGQGSKYGIY